MIGPTNQIVGKMVVFGGIARDVYNNDDFNVSFGCGQQLVVMPLSLSDLSAFQVVRPSRLEFYPLIESKHRVDFLTSGCDLKQADVQQAGGVKVEVYGSNTYITTTDSNQLQGDIALLVVA